MSLFDWVNWSQLQSFRCSTKCLHSISKMLNKSLVLLKKHFQKFNLHFKNFSKILPEKSRIIWLKFDFHWFHLFEIIFARDIGLRQKTFESKMCLCWFVSLWWVIKQKLVLVVFLFDFFHAFFYNSHFLCQNCIKFISRKYIYF